MTPPPISYISTKAESTHKSNTCLLINHIWHRHVKTAFSKQKSHCTLILLHCDKFLISQIGLNETASASEDSLTSILYISRLVTQFNTLFN